jgi:hypothetical protein
MEGVLNIDNKTTIATFNTSVTIITKSTMFYQLGIFHTNNQQAIFRVDSVLSPSRSHHRKKQAASNNNGPPSPARFVMLQIDKEIWKGWQTWSRWRQELSWDVGG